MTSGAGTLIFGGLMAWSIYRRIRKNIGLQPLRKGRTIFSIVILALALGLIGSAYLQFPHVFMGLIGGLLLGVPLGFVGLRLTRFETTEQGHFYKPNTYLGITLSVIFMGRIIYRMLFQPMPGDGKPQLLQSPLTLFIFGLTVGYFLVYYIGLLVHTHDKLGKVSGPPAGLPPVL
jgi:hypothetical protein